MSIEHEDEAEQDHDAEPCEDCGVCTLCGCDCDPTPYETGELDNIPREEQERAVESVRMKR